MHIIIVSRTDRDGWMCFLSLFQTPWEVFWACSTRPRRSRRDYVSGWLGIPPVELVEVSGLPSWSCYPRKLVPDRRQMEVSSFFCVFTLSLVLLSVCVLTKTQKAPPGQLRCAQMENQLRVHVPGLGPYPGARPGKGNIGALLVAGLCWRCLASLIRHGRPHMGPAFTGATIEDISIRKNTLHHMKHVSVATILSEVKRTPSSSS